MTTKLKHFRVLLWYVAIACSIALGTAGSGAADGDRNDAAQGGAAAIEVVAAKPFSGARSVEGVATVLSADGLVQMDGDIKAAAIAAEFSRGQLERFRQTKSLSQQTVANAEKQAQTDEAQLRLLEKKLKQAWGEGAPILGEATRAAMISEFASGAKAIVRLDFFETLLEPPQSVRITSLQLGSTRPVPAPWPAPSGNQSMPGVSYFAVIETAPGLRPGDRARSTAERRESASGVIIPGAAIIVFAGQSWCYVETAPKTYKRQLVSLEFPVEDGYVAQSGFEPGARIVVRGASVLLAREAGPGDEDADEESARPAPGKGEAGNGGKTSGKDDGDKSQAPVSQGVPISPPASASETKPAQTGKNTKPDGDDREDATKPAENVKDPASNAAATGSTTKSSAPPVSQDKPSDNRAAKPDNNPD